VLRAAGETESMKENFKDWLELEETLDFTFRHRKNLLQ
jgi:hypothetical protein